MDDAKGDDQLAVPRSGWIDRLRTILVGALGGVDDVVPFAGSAASALVDVLWRPAYEKRVESFLEVVVAELAAHSGRIGNLEEHLQRDAAISVGLAAAAAAGKTHDKAKHRYLANAVVRVTVDRRWDARADFALLLVGLVDDLTATHVVVLDLLADPIAWAKRHGRDLAVEPTEEGRFAYEALFARAFPELDDTLMISAIFADLARRGLLNVEGADSTSTAQTLDSLLEGQISELGVALLWFIAPTPTDETG